jgi:hypothetical protein
LQQPAYLALGVDAVQNSAFGAHVAHGAGFCAGCTGTKRGRLA